MMESMQLGICSPKKNKVLHVGPELVAYKTMVTNNKQKCYGSQKNWCGMYRGKKCREYTFEAAQNLIWIYGSPYLYTFIYTI